MSLPDFHPDLYSDLSPCSGSSGPISISLMTVGSLQHTSQFLPSARSAQLPTYGQPGCIASWTSFSDILSVEIIVEDDLSYF